MKKHTSQSGFTLVETLVAITILLVVMVGPMTISSQTAKSSSFASEQVTAFFLAQEGVELAQKARDDLLLSYFIDTNSDPNVFTPSNPDPWVDFTNAGGTYSLCYEAYTATQGGCGLEILTRNGTVGENVSPPIDCGTSVQNDCDLWYDPSNVRSKFTHDSSGATASPYNRRVFFTLVNANEVAVRSVVTWQSGNIRNEQRVEVESRLFNLYGN